MVYYKVFTKKDLLNDKGLVIAVGLVVGVLTLVNYFVFFHNDRWKGYVKDFDSLPKKKNKIGTMIVWSLVFLIFLSLIFSFYLMSRVDWSLYR